MDQDPHNPAPGVIPGSLSLKLYRIRTLVRRYWWVLLLTISAGLGLESWIVFDKPDLYSSSSDLIVREELETELSKRYSDSYGALIGNTLKMLESPDVFEAARRRIELESPQLGGEVAVTASVAPRTSIFTVAGTGTNPEYTRRYVDAVIAEFIVQYKGLRQDTATESKTDFSVQVEKIRQLLASETTQLNDFIKANNMEFWIQQRDEASNFLASLRNRQNNLTAERVRLQNLSPDQLLSTASQPKQIGNSQAAGAQTSNETSSFSTELISQYLTTIQELNQKQAQIEERSRVWKPKHPRMQSLQSEADLLNRTLDGIRSQTISLSKARIAAIDAELKSLDESIGVWTDKAKAASEKDGEFRILTESVKRLQTQEDKLLDSITKLDITTDTNLLKVIRKASIAEPVPKSTAKNLIMGVVGGLVIGGMILFFLDRHDDRLTSSTEILDHFSEPILGQIPDVRSSRTATGLPLLEAEDERYTYAEAFRSLRSSLIFMPNQAEMKAILLTSAIPNEGKSTLASNLAITMANGGARVLLVDADLRRGDLATIFDIDGKRGLSDILRGQVPWRECVIESRFQNLSIIPRGPVTNQSGELLLRPTFDPMFEAMKAEYDLVIFNSAPILATDDTPTLAPHFDGVLMIIRAQFTSSKLTLNALGALYQRQVNVLGLVLNCVDTETPDYYYYRYPKYYAA
ncbi:MAG: polysaccharide biosynthesis tyrosine autokinase [Chthoniobacteraceae bacterium]